MHPKTTAKDFFLYLASAIGLYVSVISFLMLSFTIIDKIFPLAGEYSGGFEGTVRSSIAALIIFFPTFCYLNWLIYKDLKANPEKKEMWVRKWMNFFNLFVAGLTVAIDLVTLIYRFLGAEDLSLRFFLKVFIVLASGVSVFVFYFYGLKRAAAEYKDSMNIFLAFVSAAVLAITVYGIILIGSPAEQRAKILDEQRVNDLVSIQSQIVYTQWQNKGTVPTTLDALKDPINGYIVPVDPETKESYAYKMLTKNSFELCASFATENKMVATIDRPVYPNGLDENWQHAATTTCFTRTIDPTLYKVTPVK